jgi:hypothetical protein
MQKQRVVLRGIEGAINGAQVPPPIYACLMHQIHIALASHTFSDSAQFGLIDADG